MIMKLNKWLYGVTALAMLAACSDKDITSGGGDNKEPQFSNGISYLGISIELPAEPVSRGGDDGDQGNDNFDDGLPVEYNVENAAILLFKGTDEAKAKFVGAYVMVSDEATDQPNGDNITTSFHRTIQVLNKPELDTNDYLYGLALVNYKEEHFEIESEIDKTGTYGDLTVKSAYKKNDNGTYSENPSDQQIKRVKNGVADATTFQEFRELITNCKFLNKRSGGSLKSIFMTNAPLSTRKGTTAQPTGNGFDIVTLAALQPNFESTELDATNNPAGCIFVERAVAKVTCSEFPKTCVLTHSITDLNSSTITTEDIMLEVDNVSWLIDNVEKTSYIIRNAQTSNPWWSFNSDNSAATTSPNRYRFVGNANMNDRLSGGNYDSNTSVHENLYRTYWCIDPKYDKDEDYNKAHYNDLTVQTENNTNDYVGYSSNFVNSSSNPNLLASPAPLYPRENTFSLANQNYMNTTRVVFKVKYKTTANKAIKQDDGSYSKGDAVTNCNLYAVRGKLNTFYLQADAENLLKRAALSNFDLKDLIVKYKKSTVTGEIPFSANDFVISFGTKVGDDATNSIMDGDYIIASLRFESDFITNYLDNSQIENINNDLDNIALDANKTYHLVPFKENTCYYVVYIQHFGDTYCKLPIKTKEDGTPEKDNEGNTIDNWKGDNTNDVYHANEDTDNKYSKLYLGRYGMVRNNWYDIAVGSIGSLGKATVPDGKVNTSDDNKTEEFYLSARIHVLSWAKRTQKVDF